MEVDMNKFINFDKMQTKIYLTTLGPDQLVQQPIGSSNPNNSVTIAIDRVLRDIMVDISEINIIQLVDLTIKLLAFCNNDVKTKVIIAVQQSVNYVLSKISQNFIDEIDVVIPKNTQFSEFLRIVISFFSEKAEAWEKQYQQFQETKDETYNDPLFKKINPLYAKRVAGFFEHVVTNSFSGQSLTSIVLNEISQYLVTYVVKKIFDFTELRERERKRNVHSAGFSPKKISCSLCGGYYFQN
ncbi:uncharacterized protein [Euwallacea similis]|uniref:uncharacterized protein n=1 Tax=Euwallacea similis TaxID=1736056 RepID=UPI00344B7880